MSTLNSAILVGGVSPPPVSDPRPSASISPLSSSSLVANPSTPSNLTGQSSGVGTRIPSTPYTSSPFMQNPQSGPSGSTSFVQGFPWNGGHIPPSAPYVGPSPTYVDVLFGNQNAFTIFSLQTSSQVVAAPFRISPFSLFIGGISTPTFQNLVSAGAGQTTYHTRQVSNPLAFEWNPFQNSATTS